MNSSRNLPWLAGTTHNVKKDQFINLNCSRNHSWSAGTLLLSIAAEMYPPELQQEPFVVSRNITLKSAGTLCGQQEPMMLAGTLLCSQQEPHTVSRNPLWPAGTLDVNRNHEQKQQNIHLNCSRNPSRSAGTSLLCITAEIYPPELQQEPFLVSKHLTLK